MAKIRSVEMPRVTAKQFIAALSKHKKKDELAKLERFFKGDDGQTRSLGVKFGTVFSTAKEYVEMPIREIEMLLSDCHYEVRMGAASIMDFQARKKQTSEVRRKELYDLYLRRHDRLNNWDFVDCAAPHVIGGYLYDFKKPRKVLYRLARSKDVWERRTAIVSTYYFIKQGELEDTFSIAGKLIHDKHELINKAVGSWIREAGKKDERRLREFLDRYATVMPRITLRYAVEKLEKKTKSYYMNLK
jgi:3-methyladenine DNA glycosylase AlkD